MRNKSDNLVEALICCHIHSGRGDKIALIGDGQSYSYLDLHRIVGCAAANLTMRAVAPGDKVVLLIDNDLELAIAWLAVMWAGGVAVLLNPHLPRESYRHFFTRVNPQLVIASQQVSARISTTVQELAAQWNFSDPADTLFNSSAVWVPPMKRASDDSAFVLFTSGTTGAPAGVMHRHSDVAVTNEDYGRQILNLTEADITFSASSLFFAYGLNSVHLALYCGGTVVMPPSSKRPDAILERLRLHRPTVFFAVPTIYRLLLDHVRADDLNSIRLCVSAGEALPTTIFDTWHREFGYPILDGIGTTEVLSTFISNRPDDLRPGSVGKPVQGFEARLISEDGGEAADGEPGVLWVRGRTIPNSYLADDETTHKRFRNGWFITNDMFRRDSQGYYYYLGRIDDVLKIGGQWVSPTNLEDVIRQHPDLQDCAIVISSDPWGLPRPCAFLVLKSDVNPERDWRHELKELCSETFVGPAYPHFVELVEDLPRTFNGKIQRVRLRELAKVLIEQGGGLSGSTQKSPSQTSESPIVITQS